MKTKRISQLVMTAATAVVTTTASAQSVGAACGCPPVSSRTVVTLDNTNSPGVVAVNGDMVPSSYTMTCDKLYILNDKFYVPANKDLYIEPGTVIKAPNIGGGNAAALIVSRDGQIWANGTESCPIIFTAQADPLDGSYAVTNRGKWGGIILLGKAYNNVRTTDVASVAAVTGINGVGLIEGLTNESRNYYGAAVGSDVPNDNSGVLRYVSIRHGGELLGANNEINGLTLAGVGSGSLLSLELPAQVGDFGREAVDLRLQLPLARRQGIARFVALDDQLLRLFGGDRAERNRRLAGAAAGENERNRGERAHQATDAARPAETGRSLWQCLQTRASG